MLILKEFVLKAKCDIDKLNLRKKIVLQTENTYY